MLASREKGARKRRTVKKWCTNHASRHLGNGFFNLALRLVSASLLCSACCAILGTKQRFSTELIEWHALSTLGVENVAEEPANWVKVKKILSNWRIVAVFRHSSFLHLEACWRPSTPHRNT